MARGFDSKVAQAVKELRKVETKINRLADSPQNDDYSGESLDMAASKVREGLDYLEAALDYMGSP